MRASELSGERLDYWVARAEGVPRPEIAIQGGRDAYSPSENWAQGGPIIDREKIDIIARGDEWDAGFNTCVESSGFGPSHIEWMAMEYRQSGPTPLIAAMRAYAASKFGDTVPDSPA